MPNKVLLMSLRAMAQSSVRLNGVACTTVRLGLVSDTHGVADQVCAFEALHSKDCV